MSYNFCLVPRPISVLVPCQTRSRNVLCIGVNQTETASVVVLIVQDLCSEVADCPKAAVHVAVKRLSPICNCVHSRPIWALIGIGIGVQ